MQFANKTQFGFDPSPDSFAGNAVANDVYSTPATFAERVGDLARMTFLRGTLRAKIRLSASDTGVFTVKLLAAGTVIASGSITITSGTVGYLKIYDIDLSALSAGISGQTALTVAVDVTTATTSATAECIASLDVEHPIVIGQ